MEISFLIPTPICLHTALPYLAELRKRNIAIHFIVDKKVREEAQDILKDASSIIDIDHLARQHKYVKLLHTLPRIIFTAVDYSPSYSRWLRQRFQGKSPLAIALLNFLIKFIPKWEKAEINRNLTSLIRRFLPNPFPTSRLIYVTTTGNPHLLCAHGLGVYTIMESWDHPCKAPVGHLSDKVFVWNEALKKDWQEYQGDNSLATSYPVKLDYAIRANKLEKCELLESRNNRIMYPATFGSTSDQSMFAEELKLIEALCEVTQGSGNKLLIKPKPNGTIGEFNKFLDYSHVEIGQYQTNGGGANYSLTEGYNDIRLGELRISDIVVNLGTTFALDAAAFGLPVVQLQMNCEHQFPQLSKLTTFPHLARHFYSKSELIFQITNSLSPSEGLAFLSEKSSYIKPAEAFSLYLRQWISPVCTLENSVSEVISVCLGEESPERLENGIRGQAHADRL